MGASDGPLLPPRGGPQKPAAKAWCPDAPSKVLGAEKSPTPLVVHTTIARSAPILSCPVASLAHLDYALEMPGACRT